MKNLGKTPLIFVPEQLDRLWPVARPMFGCHAIYVGEKIVLITRDRPGSPEDNSVCIATKSEHDESLAKRFLRYDLLAFWEKAKHNGRYKIDYSETLNTRSIFVK